MQAETLTLVVTPMLVQTRVVTRPTPIRAATTLVIMLVATRPTRTRVVTRLTPTRVAIT